MMDRIVSIFERAGEWLVGLDTDLPVLILTIILVVLAILTLYFNWRPRRPISNQVSYALLEVTRVRKFDFERVVGAFTAKNVTEYLPVERDKEIREALEDKRDILISGRAGIGKSHTALYWIQEVFSRWYLFPRWYIVRPRRQAVTSSLEQIRIKPRRYVLFLDDLDNYVHFSEVDVTSQLLDLVEHLRDQAKELIVVATIRSTKPEASLIANHLKEFQGWAHCRLPDWDVEKGKQLAELTGVDMTNWDATPLSVKSPSDEIIKRVENASVDIQLLAEAIASVKKTRY